MESAVKIYERVSPRDSILIAGVPSLGLVANIVASHMIICLKANKVGEIISPVFQDIVITTLNGDVQSPSIELFHSRCEGSNDLIILYGNSQALTNFGQYELCGKILDTVQNMGCKSVICIGGLRKSSTTGTPKVYCTATDFKTLDKALTYGLSIVQGHIFGISGLLLGLAKIRGMEGLCLLVETTGIYPDAVATKIILDKLNNILGLNIDSIDLTKSLDKVSKTLEPPKGL
ncbi:MAG: PAC2 family protein [Candidatus Bathyarchaeota archaeon]